MKQTIYKKESNNPGKTLAIFCGVHGNEMAGIMTVDYLCRNLTINAGTVYLVYANPRAIAERIRFTEKNLNRCFLPASEEGVSYEEKRATELMKLLDTCDALLDLHAYTENNGPSRPFALTEKNGLNIVSKFDIDVAVTNIDAVEKGGSDGYMYNQGKVGICVELGAIATPDKYVELGIKTAYQFLQHFDLIDVVYPYTQKPQLILKAKEIYFRQHDTFSFANKFKTFDLIKKGDLICTDGNEKVCANEDIYILFPGKVPPVGVEAFVTATPIASLETKGSLSQSS